MAEVKATGDQLVDCRSMTTSDVGQSPEISIQIQRPERFWFARVSEMPWFVDPDEVDGGQRHADRDTIRWGTVGEIIQELGGMLDRREFQEREYEDGVGVRGRAVRKFTLRSQLPVEWVAWRSIF